MLQFVLCGAAEYEPAGHVEHVEDPSRGENVPVGQIEHLVEYIVGAHVPAAQIVHLRFEP
jgi:hypothetical protein